jgi:hypothetical protein
LNLSIDESKKYSNTKVQLSEAQQDSKPKEAEVSVSEEADLLDVNNWDDVPSEPQQHLLSNPIQQNNYMDYNAPSTLPNNQVAYGAIPQQPQPPVYAIQPYGGPDTNPYGMLTQQHSAAQAPYSSAIVPSTNSSQSYPGTQPQQFQQQQQQWMPPQQQQYPPQGYAQQQPPQGNYLPQTNANPQPPTYPQQADPWATPQPSIQMQPPQY